MRPTWYAATIVEPLEKLSGSTTVLWLVVVEALQVACVNGSELMCGTAAWAADAKASAAVNATPSTKKRRRDSDRNDRRISYFLSTTHRAVTGRMDASPAHQWGRHYSGNPARARRVRDVT